MSRCRAVEGAGTRLLLGRVGKEPEADPDSDEADDIALPFSPEMGTAAPFAGGFAAGALLPSRKGATAVVVVLSPDTGAARKVELGPVHGDVPPPRVAAAGASLLVAIPDGAPHGTLVRLARLADARAPAPIPGVEIPQGTGESEAFALEVGKRAAVLAWDEFDAKAGVEVVKTVSFAPDAPQKATPPVVVSAPGSDAEAPRLVRRAAGFWAAWIASSRPRDEKRKDDRRDTPDPERVEKSQGPEEPPHQVPRAVVLQPLDEIGAPAGAPLTVTPRGGHVTAFDLSQAKDDGALVTWRDAITSDEQTPGGTVRLALVRADGTVEPRALVEDDVGSGVPLLLAADEASEGVAAFMAVISDSGAVRLASLDGTGRVKDSLAQEAALGVATPLAARGSSLFVARPHGSGLELGILSCHAGPPPAR